MYPSRDASVRAARDDGRLASVSANTFWTIVSVGVIVGIGVVPAFVGWYWFMVIPKRELSRHGGGGSGPRVGTAGTRPPSPSYSPR
jgi:hypothetical protein